MNIKKIGNSLSIVHRVKKAYIFILFLFFSGIGIIVAQDAPWDSIAYKKLIYDADQSIEAEEHEKAIQYLLRAADMSENAGRKEILPSVYVKLAGIYEMKGAYENAIDCYIKTLDLTYPTDYNALASCNEKLGDLYVIIQNAEKALASYLSAFGIYEKQDRHDALLRISGKIIPVYRIMRNYSKSLELGQKMLKTARERKNKKLQFTLLNSIGYDQFRLEQYRDANTTFHEAFEEGRVDGATSRELINIQINRSVCLFNTGNTRDAILVLKQAAELNTRPTDDYLQAKIENMIANIYLYLNDLYNAGIFSNASITSARKSGNASMLQECYLTYSKILRAGNDPDRALEYYQKYLAIRDSIALEERLAENEQSRNQFDIEKLEKEYRLKMAGENIYEMRIRQIEMEQARLRELSQKKIDSLEQARQLASLELEKQRQKAAKELVDRENQTLRYQNDLQQTTIKLNEIEEQQRLNEIKRLEKEKEQEKKMKRYIIFILVLLAFVAITILSGLISTRRKNTLLASQKREIEEKNDYLEQLNEEISTQKEMIEEKNIAITDSIMYAQKIQTAVLPPEDFFVGNQVEYFILFKPRDIVSGDFYWGTRTKEKLVITAADCTGHGVPGAFMSMLGTAFLNEIVDGAGIVEPDQILNQLRKNVIESLRQKGKSGETSDGMDIALCVIDLKKQIVQFSGANNPMFFVSHGELSEIKPDRMPIGIHVNWEMPFTKHEVPYTKGDALYIFSDGYTDQFGGPEGKKFMNRQFKSLLLEHHQKSMKKQKEILNTTLEAWRGNLEQVDDVLVIGVRL